MLSIWTEDLKDPEEKEAFERELQNSPIIRRLQTITKRWEKELDRSEVDIKTYDTANWDYKQAHKNGDRSRIYKYKSLLDLDKDTDDRQPIRN